MNAASRNEALAAELREIALAHPPAAFACSLSNEDMVITDAIHRAGLDIEVFVLDTGLLHGDTLALLAAARRTYGDRIRVVHPDAASVEEFERRLGTDAMYRGAGPRARCCAIRKVDTLERALHGKAAWITGLRRTQSPTRAGLEPREFDALRGIFKFNPLVHWNDEDVAAYLRRFAVPGNRLYALGYRSIGCAPCTRPVLPGEDERAGRWWWEHAGPRECGLHPDGGRAAPQRRVA